jgi:hypothetical protein
MIDMIRRKRWLHSLFLPLCCVLLLEACSKNDNHTESDRISAIADKVWAFSQSHPDGFTINIIVMDSINECVSMRHIKPHLYEKV